MAWIYLVLAGLFEIGFTTSMRYLGWPLKLVPFAAFLVCSIASFWLLISAMKAIPLGTAYAVWTGIGAAGTVLAFAVPENASRHSAGWHSLVRRTGDRASPGLSGDAHRLDRRLEVGVGIGRNPPRRATRRR